MFSTTYAYVDNPSFNSANGSLHFTSLQHSTHSVNMFDLVRLGQLSDVKTAMDSGKVQVNCKDPRGHTLVFFALHHKQLEIAKYLISLGADLHTPDKVYGQSAMQYIQRMKIEEQCGIPKTVEAERAVAAPEHPMVVDVEVIGASFNDDVQQ